MPVVVGVDVGGTKIQAAVLRASRVVGSARGATPSGGPEDFMTALMETVGTALATSELAAGEVAAVGIGFPGLFEVTSGDVLSAPNVPAFATRFPLSTRVAALFGGVPVTLDNDVRAALGGEYRLGAGRGYRDLLGVFVGTGVGGGLVLEGRPRRGRGAAGEIGHAVVKDGGRECGCGNRGCLEAYAGRGRMELRARELVKQGRKTALFEIQKRKGRDRLTSGVIHAALHDGDRVARELVDEATWALGLALASAQNVLDLEVIILGGGLGDRLGETFRNAVVAAMEPHLLPGHPPPLLVGTALGDLSGAVGAAIQAADELRRRTRE